MIPRLCVSGAERSTQRSSVPSAQLSFAAVSGAQREDTTRRHNVILANYYRAVVESCVRVKYGQEQFLGHCCIETHTGIDNIL